jgi:hypothetical protein
MARREKGSMARREQGEGRREKGSMAIREKGEGRRAKGEGEHGEKGGRVIVCAVHAASVCTSPPGRRWLLA